MSSPIKNKILFVLAVLFGLMFINAGLDKFLHYMPMPENMPEKLSKAMAATKDIPWLMPLVGFAELLGGLLIIFPKTRTLGALIMFPVMIGILVSNIVVDTTGLPIALILLAINVWILIDSKEKLKPILA